MDKIPPLRPPAGPRAFDPLDLMLDMLIEEKRLVNDLRTHRGDRT